MKPCTRTLANQPHPPFEFFALAELDLAGIPFYGGGVSAGFPSPAEEYLEDYINLQHLLIGTNVSATFMVRVRGNSMTGANMADGDIMIVDRSLQPVNNSVVIGLLEGEYTVKRLVKKQQKFYLKPENPAYRLIELSDKVDFTIWGVVTWCIHNMLNR